MTDTDVVVVGAGLFGSIIAQRLRTRGRSVVVVDSQEQSAGSYPAACLMKPGWYSGLGKEVHEPALALLDELYGVQDIQFKIGPAHTTVHWVPPSQILLDPDNTARVTRIIRRGDEWDVIVQAASLSAIIRARTVVVAAGMWTPNLVPVEGGLKGQAGVAFLWPSDVMAGIEPFIQVWAPYKQLVAFDRGDGTWVGDGSAIIPANWTTARENQSYDRCSRAVGRLGLGDRERGVVRTLYGVRPYTKFKPCYLREHEPGLWVATGGAKNGTIAAAWCAHEIERRTA